jgi:hypothetical protein
VVPVENRFIKKIDFLPKTVKGNLDFDVSYWISFGIPLIQNIGVSDIIGINFFYSGQVIEKTD